MQGIIFVIDATDEERLDSAVAELTSLATDNFLTVSLRKKSEIEPSQ